MNRLITAMIAFLIVSFAIAGNAGPLSTAQGTPSANSSIIFLNSNSSYSNTTNQQITYAAETYLSTRLGQSYYNNYISYYGARSYGNSSYAYFTYAVPFANGTSAMGVTDTQFATPHLLGITVLLNGTKVVGYIGPGMPYFVDVNYTKAINTSDSYGIENGSASIMGVFYNSGIMPDLKGNSTYSVAWAILSGSPLKSGVYQGLYVNVSSGKALGEYEYNPAVGISEPGPTNSYGTSDNFSMFYMPGLNQSSTSTSTSNSTDSQYILPLIIIAFFILGLAMYLSRRER